MPLSESIRNRLLFQHQTIPELIEGISEEGLTHRPDPAKWSAFENIAHLACYQPVFLERVKKIKSVSSAPAGTPPSFGRYVAEQDPAFPGYLEMPLQGLLSDIGLQRGLIIHELTGGDKIDLGLTGLHPRFGLLTLTGWTEFFLLHEAHHLYTIFALASVWRKTAASGQG
jgi:hypothetical protein